MHTLILLSLARPIREQAAMFHGILMGRRGQGKNECGFDLKWLPLGRLFQIIWHGCALASGIDEEKGVFEHDSW
jgi:hypothetical protein